MVNLWLPWFNYSNHVSLVVKPWLIFIRDISHSSVQKITTVNICDHQSIFCTFYMVKICWACIFRKQMCQRLRKRLVQLKVNILSLFTPVVQNLYDFMEAKS